MYLRPANLEEALKAMANHPWAVLAGGTDFYPARVGKAAADDTPVLDVSRLEALRGITQEGDHWRIGALTTWSDVQQAKLPRVFDALKLAAREVGGVQIQNAGTVAGNICNASPAADGIPALLALDAEVELTSDSGMRRLPLAAFVTGNRKTARWPEELVTAVYVPRWARGSRSTFLKLGARKYLVISIAMVAVALETDAARVITRARVALGACSPIAVRLTALEQRLTGQSCASDLGALVTPEEAAALKPIDDIRASAEYRKEAALTLIRHALRELASE
jgi:CO/xanthine dehydrogenase FAD-binding subunit